MNFCGTKHLILEDFKVEILVEIVELDEKVLDYVIISQKNANTVNSSKEMDSKEKTLLVTEKILTEIFTQANLKKYQIISHNQLQVRENLYLTTINHYLDLDITGFEKNRIQFILELRNDRAKQENDIFINNNKHKQGEITKSDLLSQKFIKNIDSDFSDLKLEDLIDLKQVNKLMSIFNKLYNIAVVIVDFQGNFLTSVGMSDICSNFHRKNDLSEKYCIESDLVLSKNLKKNEIKFYKCLNNMYDLVSPIYIGDNHVANFFIGQFFFEDEEIDREVFKQQAIKFGFNVEEYLLALDKIPRMSKDKIKLIISFYQDLLNSIMSLAYSKFNLVTKNHEIKANEDKLKHITDNMTDVVFTADLDFNINYISPSIEKLTGFTPQEYLQLPMEERYTPLAVKEIKEAIAEELERDKKSKNKNRSNINSLALYNKDKKIIIASIHSKFLRNQNGNPIGIIANISDITKQFQVERTLEQQLKLQALLNSIAVDYINIPTEDIENSINKTLASLATFFNVDRAYIFTYDWENKTSTNTYEWVAEGISPQIDNLQEVPFSEMDYWPDTHKQGKTIIIEDLAKHTDYPKVKEFLEVQDIQSVITIPLMKKHSCVGFIGFDSVRNKNSYSEKEQTALAIVAEILVNIANRVELERALRDERERAQNSDKLKSNLLKNISHEFRTPLNGIVGFSEILQQKSSDFETGNMAEMIYSSAMRLNHVLDSIMLLTQLETINKKKCADFKIYSVSKILKELGDLYQTQFEDKGLTFYVEIEPNLYAQVDDNLLNQAITHLLNNALKFTQKGGVQLLCSSRNNKICIDIIDTGIGIPNESLKLIFSEFRQASEGYNRAYEGVGLGLTIAKKIIDLMQGDISVKSEILSGSTFSIKLPLREIDLSQIQEQTTFQVEDIPTEDQYKPKILIVEDNNINQKLVISILKNYYLTDLANNGELAVLLAEKKKYDAILMDIHLGEGIDGLTASRIIKKNSLNIATPIIAVTGYTMLGDKDRILSEGCNYYLAKPYQKKELLKIVKQAIK